uniref:Uncharacterized protein n=1 Tax=Panagrolaimus sp. ES5 TaxID=591445 RepID=A0AC34FS95_9BILA
MEKSKRQSSRLKKSTVSSLSEKSAERVFPSKNVKNSSNFKRPIKPHQYGEIITVDETNLAGILSQPIQIKKRQIQTGTEEILGDVIVLEDVQADIPAPNLILPKKKTKKPRSPSPEVLSETESLPIHRKTKRNQIYQIVSSDEESSDIHSYKNIWEEALKDKSSSTREEYEVPEKRPYSVIPFPRAQPIHYLNKFVANKNLLSEPSFRPVSNRGPMTFSSFPENKYFNGTNACSKVAGNILGDIISKKKDFDGIFCMQIPNSLRVFNQQNVEEVEDKDIYLEKQNTSHFINDAEIQFQPKQRDFHKPVALAGFSNSQPFGKLLLLKSGKIVLQVGTRRFDVVSTSPYHDHQMAAIVDFTGASQNKQQTSSFLQPNKKMALHSLGRIQHVFSAFYNYSKILETLPPVTSSSKIQTCVEEVDLTADDQSHVKIKEEEMNVTDAVLKRKAAASKRVTKKTTSLLSQKSQVKNDTYQQKKKKRVQQQPPSKTKTTKATNLRRRKPKPSN